MITYSLLSCPQIFLLVSLMHDWLYQSLLTSQTTKPFFN
nr:MAG TPA: hypothetical protein [Caudoviricetes sp.]